jgi:alkanesulfonate monooxygenase SsuD/methylene tetrahydromethanopterin reductase-like flavin-dependent oxidoreductase (luciferase family)
VRISKAQATLIEIACDAMEREAREALTEFSSSGEITLDGHTYSDEETALDDIVSQIVHATRLRMQAERGFAYPRVARDFAGTKKQAVKKLAELQKAKVLAEQAEDTGDVDVDDAEAIKRAQTPPLEPPTSNVSLLTH